MRVDSGRLDRIMGFGLARLESRLPAFRGISGPGKLAITATRSSGTLQRLGAESGAAATAALARGHIERNSSWFARNVWKSAAAAARDRERVRLAGGAGALVAVAGTELGLWFVSRWGEAADRRKAATMLHQMMGVVCREADGSYSPAANALRARVVDGCELSPRAREQVWRSPVPSTFDEIAGIALPPEAAQSVGVFLFHGRANVTGPSTATREIHPVLVRLGLSESEASRFARSMSTEYIAGRAILSDHYVVLQQAVAEIGLSRGLPRDIIEGALLIIGSYDPYEAGRLHNRRTLSRIFVGGIRAAGALSGTDAASAILGDLAGELL